MSLELHDEQELFIVDVWSVGGGHADQSEPLTRNCVDVFFADWARDYGLEGWTFDVFELTVRKRGYNILEPVPARVVLI